MKIDKIDPQKSDHGFVTTDKPVRNSSTDNSVSMRDDVSEVEFIKISNQINNTP